MPEEVEARASMIAEWNKGQKSAFSPERCILPGDRITAANGSSDYVDMLEELAFSSKMTLAMERDLPGVLEPQWKYVDDSLSPVEKSSRKCGDSDSNSRNAPKSPVLREAGLRQMGVSALAARRQLDQLPRVLPGTHFSGKAGGASLSEASTCESSPREPRVAGKAWKASVSEASTRESTPGVTPRDLGSKEATTKHHMRFPFTPREKNKLPDVFSPRGQARGLHVG
jgi:hypothetical protein